MTLTEGQQLDSSAFWSFEPVDALLRIESGGAAKSFLGQFAVISLLCKPAIAEWMDGYGQYEWILRKLFKTFKGFGLRTARLF